MTRTSTLILALVAAIGASGCRGRDRTPDLGAIYNEAAQNIGDDRHPVVVIPGILGTKLEEPASETQVWGAFVYGAADADKPEGARLIALPMEEGVPLSQIYDNVVPTDVLDTLTLDIGLIRGLKLGAYVDILKTLSVGDYRDESLGASGAIDYGGLHYTCFQYAYDWRRDVSENAIALHQQIQEAIWTAEQATGGAAPKKVDVVAHSMGGLVLRYYLRYGPNPLPDDGGLPELTWEGAEYVSRAVLIATPSGGSVLSLEQLVEGVNFAGVITPTYQPAVLGTMPAIYQLLPRTRHARIVDAGTGDALNVFDSSTWEECGWGLVDPDQDWVLRRLLPEVDSRDERRRIALDHLDKCLARAQQLHFALDIPAERPEGLEIHLVAGDAERTPDVIGVDRRTGGLRVLEYAPGDDTVARWSALMDERTGQGWSPGLPSPIDWSRVQFVFSNHLGLTKDPAFVDNLLFLLLEMPR